MLRAAWGHPYEETKYHPRRLRNRSELVVEDRCAALEICGKLVLISVRISAVWPARKSIYWV
jgi:hypothetical protein